MIITSKNNDKRTPFQTLIQTFRCINDYDKEKIRKNAVQVKTPKNDTTFINLYLKQLIQQNN